MEKPQNLFRFDLFLAMLTQGIHALKDARVKLLSSFIVVFPFYTVNAVEWVQWTSAVPGVPGTSQGILAGQGVTVVYSGEVEALVPNGPSWNPSSTFSGGDIDSPPTTSEGIIQLFGGTASVNTILFSSPVIDPVIAIWSLGGHTTSASFVFDTAQPLSIESGGPSIEYGGGSLALDGNTVYGIEANGTVEFHGTFTQLSWSNPTSENWFGFTVGVLGPKQPAIVLQPTSQTVINGTTVSFTVTAAGSKPLIYQWLFNGQDIQLENNASLVVQSVGVEDTGAYSVTVANPYGIVQSTAAHLAVLGDGANGHPPAQVLGPPMPMRQPGKNNLVFVTHGCVPGPEVQPGPQWVQTLCDAIQAKVPADWQVVPYYWPELAWAWAPSPTAQDVVTLLDIESQVMPQAEILGGQIGLEIASQSWQHVHFIGHSAGAALIQQAADTLRGFGSSTEIHTTFLDPFLELDYSGRNWYGQNADWSDCYYAIDLQTHNFTDGPLPNTYNVDVTSIDESKKPVGIACPSSTSETTPLVGFCATMDVSTHDWPHDFYLASVNGTLKPCASGYGFPSSKEAGGWDEHIILGRGNSSWTPCGQPAPEQNPFPITLNGNLRFDLIPNAASINGYTPIEQTQFELSNDDPAWFAIAVTITNNVNCIQFESAFIDTNAAEGLLTVYWNTNQIGMIDERVSVNGEQTNHFFLPSIATEGVYILSFRLDAFDSTASTISIANVNLGLLRGSEPIRVGITLNTNSMPLIKLTGPQGYNYLLQTSTNLENWTPFVLLPNSNDVVQFVDLTATNADLRFYRATLP